MDIDLLKTFVAICDTKSFTAAAGKVGRSQSAISLQVKRLEDTLGRPLFVRGSGQVGLTEHGVLLLPHARDILSGVDEALAAFDRSTVEGVVVLGMPDDYAPLHLDRVLKAFSALYPAATVNLVIDESRVLVRRLAEGSVDLAFITEGEGPVSGGSVVFRDRITWVAPASADLHRQDPLPIAIWDNDDGYARRIFAALGGMGRAFRVAVVSRSMTGLKAAVTSGLAVSAMMRSSLVGGMRELGPAEGFPLLDELEVRLEKAHLKRSAVVNRLERHLLEEFASGGSSEP